VTLWFVTKPGCVTVVVSAPSPYSTVESAASLVTQLIETESSLR
jgi:hypothetical protein